MIKNIKKTVIAGALALAMVGTAVPVTTDAASKSGTYTSVSLNKVSSGATTFTATAKGTNKTAAAKYIYVYVKKGGSSAYAGTTVSSNSGVTNAGNYKATSASHCSTSNKYWGLSVIHKGNSNTTPTLESVGTN